MRRRAAVGAAVIGGAVASYNLVVRPWQLRWGATDAEFDGPLPGDGLIGTPDLTATRAITIRASADAGSTAMTSSRTSLVATSTAQTVSAFFYTTRAGPMCRSRFPRGLPGTGGSCPCLIEAMDLVVRCLGSTAGWGAQTGWVRLRPVWRTMTALTPEEAQLSLDRFLGWPSRGWISPR